MADASLDILMNIMPNYRMIQTCLPSMNSFHSKLMSLLLSATTVQNQRSVLKHYKSVNSISIMRNIDREPYYYVQGFWIPEHLQCYDYARPAYPYDFVVLCTCFAPIVRLYAQQRLLYDIILKIVTSKFFPVVVLIRTK